MQPGELVRRGGVPDAGQEIMHAPQGRSARQQGASVLGVHRPKALTTHKNVHGSGRQGQPSGIPHLRGRGRRWHSPGLAPALCPADMRPWRGNQELRAATSLLTASLPPHLPASLQPTSHWLPCRSLVPFQSQPVDWLVRWLAQCTGLPLSHAEAAGQGVTFASQGPGGLWHRGVRPSLGSFLQVCPALTDYTSPPHPPPRSRPRGTIQLRPPLTGYTSKKQPGWCRGLSCVQLWQRAAHDHPHPRAPQRSAAHLERGHPDNPSPSASACRGSCAQILGCIRCVGVGCCHRLRIHVTCARAAAVDGCSGRQRCVLHWRWQRQPPPPQPRHLRWGSSASK